ncbi:Adenylate cyclase isoform A [Chlorella sorokiniana]|uniref:Adenylate cyclase isoform A n=1 Tax=Chlorella sorokiniana TaxID=3076 RepID=A0A2P6THE5_CHLSO|nr:Adenylate cyclase isoform A [Chlorella sorokiniana]|eukprot:PRW33711.1 Adenylate cyclase isoform A [Chlorella sorokiniana]
MRITAALCSLGQLTGLVSLEVHVDSNQAQQHLQAALQQLSSLTSLSAKLAKWPYVRPNAGQAELERLRPLLDVSVLPHLAVLSLSQGGVDGLSWAELTRLQLSDTDFGVEDLCCCSRLVALEGTLIFFAACLKDFVFQDPVFERELPPGCLPALRSLSLTFKLGEDELQMFEDGEPIPLPHELSALSALTQLCVEGPTPDQLRPEDIPEFVAGLPDLRTLRLSGNLFRSARHPSFFPGLPGPVCSSLRRLELRACFLRAVPPCLSHLTALTALDLSGNRTLEICDSDVDIFRLTRLRELHLAKPRSTAHEKTDWSQALVTSLLGVQRACAWLDVQSALKPLAS